MLNFPTHKWVTFLGTAIVALLASPAIAAPGYSVVDSTQAGGPGYFFNDISGTGTAVVLGDDEESGAVPIGFTFRYFGIDYTNVYISSNGFLTVLPGQSTGCCDGQPIPGTGSPNGIIAGVWVDLYPPGGGSITYETLGVAPNRRFIVQFTTIQHYNSGAGGLPVTFQFKLFERTNLIEVLYATDAAAAGYTRSAGVENHDGTRGVQYYLGPGPFVTPLAVRYIPVCATPGPDLGNYYCSGIGYNFTDISGSGTSVSLDDDEVSGAIPLGFRFNYYGVDYTDIFIGSNGFLTVLPGQGDGCCEGQLQPTAGTPDGVIAGWWEDLAPPVGGSIRYQTLGVSPDRIFIAQFTDIFHFGGSRVTFEFKLFERSNAIEVHYATIPTDNDGSPSAAGIENQAGTTGLQHTFGDIALVTPAAVRYTPGTRPVYIRSTVGPPFGETTNESAMDMVFGVGNWDDLRYETGPPDLLNPNRGFVYMEGSDDSADELEAFLGANQASIEAWVADRRCLFINAAPSEGNGMSYGFGGVALTYIDVSDNGNAVNPGYPIFNGPFTPVVAAYTGNSFGHGTISGGGVASLIDSENSVSILAEKAWGSGFAGFGGMTTDNYHAPQPEAHNLRANIIHYLSHHNCEVTPPYCGNGMREAYEACDDGNGVAGGCCTADCRLQPDTDGDGFCDTIDPCPLDPSNDADGDGACGDVDCAPANPGAYAVPGELTLLSVTKINPSTISLLYTTPTGGTGWLLDTVGGSESALPVGPGGGDEFSFCDHNFNPITHGGNPGPGAALWFIARAQNACGNGTYGYERRNTLPPFPLFVERMTTTCP